MCSCIYNSIHCLNNVVEIHSQKLKSLFYPCPLSVKNLSKEIEFCHLVPQFEPAKIFFLLDNMSKFPKLEFPVIRSLTLLVRDASGLRHEFTNRLRKFGRKFLVLLESYNQPAINFIDNFRKSDTYYCQVKLLCRVDEAIVSNDSKPQGVEIRNFSPGDDNALYSAFYNQVLGFLGTIVDTNFVEAFTKRPSFDPEGYFLAESGKAIVGFLSIEKEPWGDLGSGFGYIYQIGVTDEWKGTGLSECLLSKAFEFALDNGINRIGVGVRKSNKEAFKFFHKHGFHEAYNVRGYLVDLQ